jgi:hypothetical protein
MLTHHRSSAAIQDYCYYKLSIYRYSRVIAEHLRHYGCINELLAWSLWPPIKRNLKLLHFSSSFLIYNDNVKNFHYCQLEQLAIGALVIFLKAIFVSVTYRTPYLGTSGFRLDLRGYELSVTKFEFLVMPVEQCAWDIHRCHWCSSYLNLHNAICATSHMLKWLCYVIWPLATVWWSAKQLIHISLVITAFT